MFFQNSNVDFERPEQQTNTPRTKKKNKEEEEEEEEETCQRNNNNNNEKRKKKKKVKWTGKRSWAQSNETRASKQLTSLRRKATILKVRLKFLLCHARSTAHSTQHKEEEEEEEK